MPTTVNGVGTHYYGKRDVSVRNGRCQSCGRVGPLSSYNTRLWGVFLFIPVIPLGRKRIIDECASCRRHFAAAQDKWEMSKQLAISGAIEQFRSQPSVETALDLHAKMLVFRMFEDADRLRAEVVPQFADSVLLQMGFGTQLDAAGRFNDATPYFTRALELRPDMPEARSAMARRRLVAGQLDEARALLDYLFQPGAPQGDDFNSLMQLAEYFQRAGRHADALDVCKRVLAERPDCGKVHAFRKFVSVSESKTGATESMLPSRPFSLRSFFSFSGHEYPAWQRNLAIAGIIIGLLIGGLAVHNEYRRRHRTLVVLNEMGQKAMVAVDGRPPVTVAQRASIVLPEGRHHVVIDGSAAEELEIDMRSGYFARWTKSPVWAINVGGAAPLLQLTLHYAAKQAKPPSINLLVGRTFVSLADVDYAFVEPPQRVSVPSHQAEVVKTQLMLLQAAPTNILPVAMAIDADQGLRFAESHLAAKPDDELLLSGYTEAAAKANRSDRAKKYLKARLAHRPVSIPWHRAYEDLHLRAEERTGIAAEYDTQIKKEPKSAALLYLRGRVTDDRAESSAYFHRSIDADAKFPWAWYALAYDSAARGEWAQSRDSFQKAIGLGMTGGQWKRLWHEVRLATGDAPALEREYRQAVSTKPGESVASELLWLCDVLAYQKKIDAGHAAISEWERRLAPAARNDDALRFVRAACLYELGDLNALLAGSPSQTSPVTDLGLSELSILRVHALLASGRVAEAAKEHGLERSDDAATLTALSISVGFQLGKDEKSAASWREKACAGFDRSYGDVRRAAAMLRAAASPTRQQLDDLVLRPGDKALVLTALALRFPERGTELGDYARRLNVSRFIPYQLVQRAVDRVKP